MRRTYLILRISKVRRHKAACRIQPSWIGVPALLVPPPLTSMLDLLSWYRLNLCETTLTDPRGNRVWFEEEQFIHFAKITDQYGREPKNKKDAIRRINCGELKMFHGTQQSDANFSLQRVQDLRFCLDIARDPDLIVPNWQPFGRANPGEAYIRDFGSDRRKYRVLICGLAGRRRLPITLFRRERFAGDELRAKLYEAKRPLIGGLF